MYEKHLYLKDEARNKSAMHQRFINPLTHSFIHSYIHSSIHSFIVATEPCSQSKAYSSDAMVSEHIDSSKEHQRTLHAPLGLKVLSGHNFTAVQVDIKSVLKVRGRTAT